MKEKTSITLSQEVLKSIDRIAGSKQSRSAFIEAFEVESIAAVLDQPTSAPPARK